MAWIRVDDHFDEHPKLAKAGPLGWALWMAGLAYCNRNLTDGFIPWNIARGLVNWEFLGPAEAGGARKHWRIGVSCGHVTDDVTCDRIVTLLVDAGLWEQVEGGYFVHDYPEYQPSRDEVVAEREKNAERKRRSRENRKQVTGDVTEMSRRDSGVSHGVVTSHPTPTPTPTRRDKHVIQQQQQSRVRAKNGADDAAAAAAFSSTYQTTLGDKSWSIAVGMLTNLSPEVTDGMANEILCDVERDVGALSLPQLRKGLDAARLSLERAMNGPKPIAALKPFATKVIADRLREVANVH